MLRHVAPERPAASRCFLSTDAVDIFVYNICRQSVYTNCRHRMSMLFDMPPAPPPGTGYHRYIFKLYGQGQDTIQVSRSWLW